MGMVIWFDDGGSLVQKKKVRKVKVKMATSGVPLLIIEMWVLR